MKALILIFSLSMWLFGANLYKAYVLGANISIFKNLEKLSSNDVGFLPQQETSEIKYYKTKSGEVLMFVKGQLFSVILLNKEYSGDIKDLVKTNAKEIKGSSFLGTTISSINKETRQQNVKQFSKIKEGRDYADDLYLNAEFMKSIVYITEIYKEKETRTIFVVGKDFNSVGSGCKTCDYVNGNGSKIESVSLVIFAP